MELTATTLTDGSNRQIFHRGTEADLGVLTQVFESQDYALTRLTRCAELRSLYQSILQRNGKPFILDGGANIGASTYWFAKAYPGSHVVAFEPDPQNFQIMQRNCVGLNVELHEAALGSRNGKASIHDPGIGEWGYRTKYDENGSCPVRAIAEVIRSNIDAGGTPFIVKLDIEGGEKDVFQEPTDWVDQVPILIVELHDALMPKQRTSQPFLQCVAKRDRDFVYSGENVFSIRNT